MFFLFHSEPHKDPCRQALAGDTLTRVRNALLSYYSVTQQPWNQGRTPTTNSLGTYVICMFNYRDVRCIGYRCNVAILYHPLRNVGCFLRHVFLFYTGNCFWACVSQSVSICFSLFMFGILYHVHIKTFLFLEVSIGKGKKIYDSIWYLPNPAPLTFT